MIQVITIEEMKVLIETPKTGRYLAQQPTGAWQAFQVDWKLNARQFSSAHKRLAKQWLKQ